MPVGPGDHLPAVDSNNSIVKIVKANIQKRNSLLNLAGIALGVVDRQQNPKMKRL